MGALAHNARIIALWTKVFPSGARMPTLSTLRVTRPTTEALFKTVLALVLVGVISALSWWTWQDFDGDRREAEARVSAAAMVAKGHAARSLAAIDAVLASVAELAERDGVEGFRSEQQWQRLRHFAARLPETGEIFIVDSAGRQVAATPVYPAPNTDVSDREWFRQLKDGNEAFHIGRALKGRSVHDLFFPVARAIRGGNGSFIGAVQVGVGVNYIAELLRDLDLGPGAALGLYRASDGVVVARHPMTEAMLNETVAALPFFAALEGEAVWTGWVHIDGEDRLLSARRVKNEPIIAAVSMSKDQVYANAWRLVPRRALEVAALCAVLFALTGAAVRQARSEASLRDRKCSFLSRSWYEFTGQTPEAGLGQIALDTIHPDDRAGVRGAFLAANEKRAMFQVEHRVRRHDGAYRWMIGAAAPRFNRDGEFLGYIGSVIDISERKEAELALVERNAQLALAGKAAQVGGWILDVRKDRIQVTEGYVAIYQLPVGTKEISVDQWRATVHPEDIKRLDKRRTRSFGERQRERLSEYRIVSRDGAVRWIESRGFVAYDGSGRPQRIVGVSIDITDRKRAEEGQKQLIAELDHRVKNVLAKVAPQEALAQE